MADALPLITIIIVNYDTTAFTLECLESLSGLECPDFNYNILVVDNGSQQVFKIPKKMQLNNLELIRIDNNIGFTGGNNLGMSHAVENYNSDYFLLLNSDTTVTPNFLHELYLTIQGDNRGIAVSKIYFEKGWEFHKKSYSKNQLGQVIWFAGGTIDWPHLSAFHRGVDEVDRGQFDHLRDTDFATGCCMLLKRDVIEQVGILDKKYFLYLEDMDFSLRARRKGYKIVFCPNSIIYHKNAGSTGGSGSAVQVYYQTRNRLYFFFKYAKLRYKLTVFRLMWRKLLKGEIAERRAALDFMLRRFGKQPLV